MAKASAKTSDRKRRAGRILSVLEKAYPDAKCSLKHRTPLELLVATILSAQCTDDRVNIVTRDLFRNYRSARDYAESEPEALEKAIQSTGFFRNKAKSIRGMAQALVEKHKGEVPATMDELTALAGVGRKTANVVLGNAFGQNVGVVVDTHVNRLSQRLGLSTNSNPEKIEQDLMAILPREKWTLWSHLMIYHGRAICTARNPMCEKCPVFKDCPSGPIFMKEKSRKSASAKK